MPIFRSQSSIQSRTRRGQNRKKAGSERLKPAAPRISEFRPPILVTKQPLLYILLCLFVNNPKFSTFKKNFARSVHAQFPDQPPVNFPGVLGPGQGHQNTNHQMRQVDMHILYDISNYVCMNIMYVSCFISTFFVYIYLSIFSYLSVRCSRLRKTNFFLEHPVFFVFCNTQAPHAGDG